MAVASGNAIPKITLGGSRVTDSEIELLLDARASSQIGSPSSCSLRFDDPDFELFGSSFCRVTDDLELAVAGESGASVPIFTGTVTGVAIDQDFSDRHQLVIVAHDGSSKLGRVQSPLAHLNTSVSEVVETIAQRNGLSTQVTLPSFEMDYFLEVEDDFSTLDLLLAQVGGYWWIEANKLVAAVPSLESARTLTWGESLLRFSARYEGVARSDQVTVRGWDPDAQEGISGSSSRSSFSSGELGANLRAFETRTAEAPKLGGDICITDLPVSTVAEAEQRAEAIQSDLASSELFVSGETIGEPSLSVGSTVSVEGLGGEMAGSFFLSRVEHRYSKGDPLKSRFEAGRNNQISVADRIQVNRRKVDRSLRQFAIGTVTNTQDPDNLGRIKFKDASVSDSDESTWARVLGPGAGADRGLQLPFDLGDEVLVAYLSGDSRYPIVLGGLWSRANVPPLPDPPPEEKVAERTLRFGSGAEIGVSADDQAEEVVLKFSHQNAETFTELSKEGQLLQAHSDGKLRLIVGDASIELSGDGKITITGTDISLSATNELSLEGQNVTIKGQAGALVDGGGSKADLQPAGATLESSGITAVKGSMVQLN